MFWRVFLNFLCPFLLSHLLINYQISSSKNWPANRKRDFLSESANRIPKTFVATPSIELKKRIHIVSISRHNPFGKLFSKKCQHGIWQWHLTFALHSKILSILSDLMRWKFFINRRKYSPTCFLNVKRNWKQKINYFIRSLNALCKCSEEARNMSFLDRLIDGSIAPKQNEAHPADACCSAANCARWKDNIAISSSCCKVIEETRTF